MIRLGNNEVLKTLRKNLTFVDADANAEGSAIALRERCLGELICASQITVMTIWTKSAGF